MARVGALQTQGSITSTPHQDFHASNAELAFESCLANPFSNNVVITFEKSAEKINVRYSVVFLLFQNGLQCLLSFGSQHLSRNLIPMPHTSLWAV